MCREPLESSRCSAWGAQAQPQAPVRELEFTSVGNSWVNFLLRGRQQRRGWKCSGPLVAIHQPSPIVLEKCCTYPEQIGAALTKLGLSHFALTPAQQLFGPGEECVSACQGRPHPKELCHCRTLTKPTCILPKDSAQPC